MSDDLPISDVADQLHDDLLVKRLTDSDNTGFSNDLEKGASVDEVPKTASGGFFYSLVRPTKDEPETSTSKRQPRALRLDSPILLDVVALVGTSSTCVLPSTFDSP